MCSFECSSFPFVADPRSLLVSLALSFLQLQGSLLREYGTEAVLKLRTSLGLKVVKYLGNFHSRADTEADLAGVDSDKAIFVQLVRNDIAPHRPLHTLFTKYITLTHILLCSSLSFAGPRRQ